MADDSTYTVYRAGQDSPVRVVRGAGRAGAAGGSAVRPGGPSAAAESLAGLSRRRRQRAPRRRAAIAWTACAVAAAAGALALLWIYGRQPLLDLWAVLDLAEATGEVPTWMLVGVPAVAVAIAVAVTAYLALGRHIALKLVGLAVVTVTLAAPGFALGWTNGTLGEMGDRSADVVAVVEHTREKLEPALPDEAVSILLLGADVRPDDPGRADTLVLVRLDPKTRSISMLSLPRDLYVELPGRGYDKINAAYPYGGPALCVETVGQLTGLPIHHFMEVDFDGFWHVVNILGGVYYPVDRRYYNPESSTWKSIDLEPGYQLMDGHDALDFVRFRHDARGDFSRMQRQQTFLKEMQRQSARWNKDWRKVTDLLTAVTGHVTSDLDSLRSLLPLASLALTLDTSNVHTVRVEGGTQMMGDISYVVASTEEIQAAVEEFSNPTQAPVASAGRAMPKKAYGVRVVNGSGVPGIASATAEQLRALGYQAKGAGNAESFDYETSVVYAPEGMRRTAEQFVRLMYPAELRLVPRTPGVAAGVTVIVGRSFGGTLHVPEPEDEAELVVTDERYDEAGWQALDKETPIKPQMPGIWSPGLVYDEFRAYTIRTQTGRQAAAAVVVGHTPRQGYFSIQMMRWVTPPAIAHPTTRKVIDGITYLQFYNGAKLHMVAWKKGKTLYWILNSLDDQLPAEFMMALATSFEPVNAVQTEAAPQP